MKFQGWGASIFREAPREKSGERCRSRGATRRGARTPSPRPPFSQPRACWCLPVVAAVAGCVCARRRAGLRQGGAGFAAGLRGMLQ